MHCQPRARARARLMHAAAIPSDDDVARAVVVISSLTASCTSRCVRGSGIARISASSSSQSRAEPLSTPSSRRRDVRAIARADGSLGDSVASEAIGSA